jgi:hypothetical protein
MRLETSARGLIRAKASRRVAARSPAGGLVAGAGRGVAHNSERAGTIGQQDRAGEVPLDQGTDQIAEHIDIDLLVAFTFVAGIGGTIWCLASDLLRAWQAMRHRRGRQQERAACVKPDGRYPLRRGGLRRALWRPQGLPGPGQG